MALRWVLQVFCVAPVYVALVWGYTGCANKGEDAAQGGPGTPRDQPGGQIIATIGQHHITSADLRAELEALPPAVQVRFRSPERKKELVQRLVERELLAQEALRRGLGRDPEVGARFKRAMADAMAIALRQELVRLEDITDAEVREHYEGHRSEFTQDFDREQASVRNRLFELRRNKALADYLKGLRKTAKIEINEQRLAGLAGPETPRETSPATQVPQPPASGGQ